jgi:exopolysaccharide production protein ExoZ
MAIVLCHFNEILLLLTGHPKDALMLFQLSSGVDVFFVVSGFVMVYANEHLFAAPGASFNFMVRRIIRIAPIYWIITAFFVWVSIIPVTATQVACSALFLPCLDANGQFAPLLGPGWTLNLEMFFYVLFAVALRWRFAVAVPSLCCFIVVFVALGFFIPEKTPLRFLSDPMLLEFVFGMLLALAYRAGLALPNWLRLILIAAGLATIFLFFANGAHVQPSGARFLQWGVPSLMIVAACVLGDRRPDEGPTSDFIRLLGDSSYALYLLHPAVAMLIVQRLWNPWLQVYPPITVISVAVVVALVAAVLVFLLLEKPLMTMLGWALRPRPALLIPAQSET